MSKRAVFEGVVADPALDGGVVACCVLGNATGGAGGGRNNVSKTPGTRGAGGQKRSAGVLSSVDNGVGTSETVTPVAVAKGAGPNPDNARGRTTDTSGRSRDGFVGPERPAFSNGSNDRGGDTNNNDGSNKTSNKRKKAAMLASASTCATTGGSLAPAAFVPRGSTAAALRGGGGDPATAADSLGAGNDGDHRRSSVFVWPRKLEATSGEAGFEAKVPYRLTCVRATAFEARFKGAHNALLAGTKEGLALAFDWGCLIRESAGGGVGGGEGGRESGKARPNGELLPPSAQVTHVTARNCEIRYTARTAVNHSPCKMSQRQRLQVR